jgi:hypothetical protein
MCHCGMGLAPAADLCGVLMLSSCLCCLSCSLASKAGEN